MPIDQESSARRYLIVTLALAAGIYLPALAWSFGHDQNVFAAIGSLVLHGFAPYRDAWDIKPPNIFYVYALAEALFGRHELSARLLDFFSTVLSSGLIFKLLSEVLSGSEASYRYRTASIGGVLWAMASLILGLPDSAQTETFAQPFILAAIYYAICTTVLTRTAFLSGVLMVIATFFKLTHIAFAFTGLLLLLYSGATTGRRMKLGLAYGFGFLLVSAVELGALAIVGGLPEYIRITTNVIRYHAGQDTVSLLQALRASWIYLDIYIVWALMGAASLLFWKERAQALLTKRVLVFVALYLVGIVVVLVQRKGWGYHYQVMLPGLVPLVAIGIGSLTPVLAQRWKRFVFLSTLLVLGFYSQSGMIRQRHISASWKAITDRDAYLASLGTPRGIYEPRCTDALAHALEEETYARDNVFILGHEPGAYWRSDRVPATRYLYTLLLSSPVIRDRDIVLLNEEVVARKPKTIVIQLYDTLTFSGKPMTSMDLLQSEQFTVLRNELRGQYYAKDTVCDKFIIYRRMGVLGL